MLANANVEPNWNLFVFHCNGWKFILEFQRQIKSHKIRLRSHSDQLASKQASWRTRWYWYWGFARNWKVNIWSLKGGSRERVCTSHVWVRACILCIAAARNTKPVVSERPSSFHYQLLQARRSCKDLPDWIDRPVKTVQLRAKVGREWGWVSRSQGFRPSENKKIRQERPSWLSENPPSEAEWK